MTDVSVILICHSLCVQSVSHYFLTPSLPLSHFVTYLGPPQVCHTSQNPLKTLMIAQLQYTLLNLRLTILSNYICVVL